MSLPSTLDHAALFIQLQDILSELYEGVTRNLAIRPRSHQPLQHLSSPDSSVTGLLLTFASEELDN